MSEHTLHTETMVSGVQIILHTKMCNVRTHVTHENIMFPVRIYVMYKTYNVQTYVTHKCKLIFCLNLWYIRKYEMSEHMLHTTMRCFQSDLMLHTKICVRKYVTHENMMPWCQDICYIPKYVVSYFSFILSEFGPRLSLGR